VNLAGQKRFNPAVYTIIKKKKWGHFLLLYLTESFSAYLRGPKTKFEKIYYSFPKRNLNG
jgi:hypothetical protein